MIPKYTIEYSVPVRKHALASHYSTDDPVACVEFLKELLERGLRVLSLKHEGVELPRADGDKLIKTAAGMLAADRVCTSLGIRPEEEHFRFGFAA
jgi:hypothetical protein